MWIFTFDKETGKKFDKLDKAVKKRIQKYIDRLEQTTNPRVLGEHMVGEAPTIYKYRVGNYRLIVDIYDNTMELLGIDVGPRGSIYNKFHRN